MRTGIVAGSSLLAGLVLAASPLPAQRIGAAIVVRGGPVAGHVVIDNGYSTYHRPPVVVYRRPPVRRVVVEHAPRIIVVERVHRHRYAKHWRRQGYRPVTLYYVDGRYYDRHFKHGPRVREVVVYQRDGRYYRECDDQGHRRRHHNDWDD